MGKKIAVSILASVSWFGGFTVSRQIRLRFVQVLFGRCATGIDSKIRIRYGYDRIVFQHPDVHCGWRGLVAISYVDGRVSLFRILITVCSPRKPFTNPNKRNALFVLYV